MIDWTWLNNVCLQLIRRPHRLRFTSRSFRAERALQLLAVPVETDLAILISDFADFSALLPQVSNLNSSSSHLVSFHGCCGHWKSDSHNQENRMCHENPLHHVYIVRLIFGANDSCSVQGCRLLSQWILQVGSAGQNTQHKKSYVILQDLRLALQPSHWHVRQSLKIFSDPNTASLLSDSMVQPGSQLLGMCFQHSKQQEPCLALSLAPHTSTSFSFSCCFCSLSLQMQWKIAWNYPVPLACDLEPASVIRLQALPAAGWSLHRGHLARVSWQMAKRPGKFWKCKREIVVSLNTPMHISIVETIILIQYNNT